MGKKQNSGPSEHKTLPCYETKVIDEDQGIVEQLFAIHGILDLGGDISHPGSFTKTFTERGHKVKILDRHQTDSVLRVVGKPLSLQEVGRDELPAPLLDEHPEATGGAKVTVQYLLNTPEGLGVFNRIKAGAIDESSYGYDAIQVDYSTIDTKDGESVDVRNLREIKLYEVSSVVFAMNPATQTLSAKDGEEPQAEDDKGTEQSLSERVEGVRSAFSDAFNTDDDYRYWAAEVFEDHLIVSEDTDKGQVYWKLTYEADEEGEITFAPRAEWVEGDLVFTPAGKAEDEFVIAAAELALEFLEQDALEQQALEMRAKSLS